MSNLIETSTWDAGIYQLETSDPVLGGPDGVSNRQGKALANRTAWLKKEVETARSGLEAHESSVDPHAQYAPKESPVFTGTPKVPTVTSATKTDQAASTAFVHAVVAALVNSSPAALDTLAELAAALGNDANFSTTVMNALANKADKASLDSYPRVYSITALPTANVGPIVVAECDEVWSWVSTSYFTGYRSPLSGRPLDGHTVTPLASEVDAVGGELSKTDYAPLWGYARENGLVVTQTTWDANRGAHYFVDVSSTKFRVPDLRNMFRRFTGTDADTANARAIGSRQLDALQRVTGAVGDFPNMTSMGEGAFAVSQAGAGGYGATSVVYNRAFYDNARVARTSKETRPQNAAYHPRIHV